MSWSWLGASYHDQIVAPGKQPVFLLLVGLLAGFGSVRTSTRLIRARSAGGRATSRPAGCTFTTSSPW